MRRFTSILVTCLALTAVCLAAGDDDAEWQRRLALYAVPEGPANVQVVNEQATDRGILREFTMAAFDGGVVYGLVALPRGEGPWPVVLFLHGLGGSHRDVSLAAPLLVPKGCAVVGLDAVGHGQRRVEDDRQRLKLLLEGQLMRGTVRDYRRLVSWLADQPEFSGKPIGLIGASMGAIMGAVLAAVEPKICAALLIVGGGNLPLLLQNSAHPAAKAVRELLNQPEIAQRIADVDPVNYIGHISPRPVWMLNGSADPIIPVACAQALYEAAREPKRIIWYEGGHMPPLATLVTTIEQWLKECLLGGEAGQE